MEFFRKKPLRILAVDDSAVMRGILRMIFQKHAEKPGDLPPMELCGIVEDGVECLSAVLRLRPDVVVLDLEMPRMHGLDVLKRLRLQEPGLPVIMCSSYTQAGARSTLEALTHGAADYVMKPSQQHISGSAMDALAGELLPKIAALAGLGSPCLVGAAAPLIPLRAASSGPTIEIVVIAVSTGGPAALEQMLPRLSQDLAVPVMIVQHMPKLFTGALAERLDRCCTLQVKEAREGSELHPGTIWLAPGDAHMEVARRHGNPVIHLHHQPSLNHCKPSADYLFHSAARLYGAATLAVVMTGMGSDGLAGARLVHQAGGIVLAQDAASSAVWGMPGRVSEAGIARPPVPLAAMAREISSLTNAGRGVRPTPHPATAEPDTPRRAATVAAAPRQEVIHGLL